ncbi:MAG: hypothetical protein A2Y19_02630 [Firmicutes bacterium GWE2_51_13]|nr:MAG: hypothetical protein A2Y19_02630 [Firmicutes bacterium GWE2_51_13]
MNNHSFENGTIIFSEPHAQPALIRNILEKTPVLAGVQTISLANYLRSLESSAKDPTAFFCETARICDEMKDELEVLGSMLVFPQTIKEIADFMLELDAYDVDVDGLPESTPKERDVKKCLQRLSGCDLPGKTIRSAFDRLLAQTNHRPIYLSNSDEDHLTAKYYRRLLSNGARLLDFTAYSPTPILHHAVNSRAEALGIAQKIASDPMDFHKQMVVCLDPATDLPVLKANFTRLNLPFTVLSESFVLPEAELFIRLMKYSETQCIENWVSVLSLSCFSDAYPLINYIEDFGIPLSALLSPLHHVNDAMKDSTLWDGTQKKTYLQMEERAEELRRSTESILKKASLACDATWKEKVEVLYSICVEQSKDTEEGRLALLQVKRVLEKAVPLLTTHPQGTDLLNFLDGALRSRPKTNSSGVLITDLGHFHIPGIQRIFVMSASQKNYPQMATYSGLFDDVYREKTGLPSLKERYEAHMKRVDDLFTWSPELVFSYATGNYEGKSNELSFEIESFCEKYKVKAKPWPLVEATGRFKGEPKLSQENMKALLYPNGEVKGSISAIERFFECPYKYFLATALRLRTKPEAKIETNIIGTLMHAIFEHAIEQHHKDYPKMEDSAIAELAQPYFTDLHRLYPHRSDYIETLKNRLLTQVRKVFDRLVQIEAETLFIPSHTEMKFERDLQIHPSITLKLGGFIDRVDTTADQLRIMDYKSSGKKLSEKKVLTGQQLQLMTYLWIASEELRKEAAGAYYISLKQENTPIQAGKVSLRPVKVEEYDEAFWQEQAWKIHKLKGWTFADPRNLDFKGRNIDKLKLNKDGNVVTMGKPYSIELVKQALNELYTDFGRRIADADISRSCTPDACTYCDFVRMCQFRGEPLNVKNRTTLKKLQKGDGDQ